MEIEELNKEIDDVEGLMEYLKPLYGELRKTPLEDMQQRIDALTDPLSKRFNELITFSTINDLKQVRDKNPNNIVKRKIDALLFFMERKTAEEHIKKLIDAEIINAGKSGNMDKKIIGEGISIVGYANPYLGKLVEEGIGIVYGYVFNEKGLKVKVDLREKEMTIAPDADKIDIVHGCAHILEFAIREYEPGLWDEYKRIKMRSGQLRLCEHANTEFNQKLLSRGILTDSAASGMFAMDFGSYAFWRSNKIEKELNGDIFNFFNEKMSRFEMPGIDDMLIY